jgi:phosphohistidine phosphatase
LNIYLIRHAQAEPTTHLKKDRERELTAEGIQILKESATSWKNFITGFDFILSSPFRRALHTAEILADYFGYKDEIIRDNSLAPGSNTNAIIQLAASLNGERIAFIGHQPDIGFQISSLICTSEVNLKMSPATIVNISFNGYPKIGKGLLKFLLPPSNL